MRLFCQTERIPSGASCEGVRLVRQLDRTRQQCTELPEDAARQRRFRILVGYARKPFGRAEKDLKFFQEIKGGKALLCWIVQDLGDQMTPPGQDPKNYWIVEKGGGNFVEGVKAYANAICDTIEKYNLDGFDIDYEPGYGHSGSMANGRLSAKIRAIRTCSYLSKPFQTVCVRPAECW